MYSSGDSYFNNTLGPGDSGTSGRSGAGWPDPFSDLASSVMPVNMIHILRYCEFLVSSIGELRSALERILSYFITDVELLDTKGDEYKDRYARFLDETLNLPTVLHQVGFDYLCYGNSFISVMPSFRRYLSCSKCYIEHPLKIVYEDKNFDFQWLNYEFHAKCQKCGYSGIWKVQDRRGTATEISVKRWNPHEIEILHDAYKGECDYIWKIPADYRKQITTGKLFHLERVNMEVIKAIKANQYFRFASDAIFHLCEESLAGIRSRGWGISRILSNFKQAWYVQVLKRYNEAIALDYIIPFRVLTPSPGPGGGSPEMKDPVYNFGLGNFVSRVNGMLRKRNRDPAAWNVLPFPVEYKALGGDAKTLAPVDLINQGTELLLNNIGVPVEMFKGTLQVQTAPAALRLFESQWQHLVNNLNRFLRYLSSRLSTLLSWEKVTLRLTRVTTADDLNKQMARLQLMSGSQISQSTGLRSIGIDWKEELKNMMKEKKYQATQEKKFEDEMNSEGLMQSIVASGDPAQQMQQQGQQQQGQGQGQSSDPSQQMPQQPPSPVQEAMASMPGANNNVKQSPQDLLSLASTLAQKLLALPDAQRTSELINLKKTNPALHGITRSLIDQMRNQARTAGGQMLLAQQQGQQQQGQK